MIASLLLLTLPIYLVTSGVSAFCAAAFLRTKRQRGTIRTATILGGIGALLTALGTMGVPNGQEEAGTVGFIVTMLLPIVVVCFLNRRSATRQR